MTKPPRIFHYTLVDRLDQIIASGEIRTATAFVPRGERPVVWFSTHPIWEPTADKLKILSPDLVRLATDAEMDNIGRARIEVAQHTAPYEWGDFRRQTFASKETASQLAQSARAQGSSASAFRFSLKPVPANAWLAIELWNGAGWVLVNTRGGKTPEA
jgi:hypothetical protein